jgi:hypothetical protein
VSLFLVWLRFRRPEFSWGSKGTCGSQGTADLRSEGVRVLLHGLAAEQRTPIMAVAYAAHTSQDRAQAAPQLRAALPSTQGRRP